MLACLDSSNNENVDLVPCDPTGQFKSCCSRGDSCASNGLCVTRDEYAATRYYINGCLVEDWDDPSCPTQCFNVSGNGVKPCGKGQFCCFGSKGCDCKEDEVFNMEPVRIIASIPLEAAPSIAIAMTTISYEVFSPADTTSLTPCTSTTDAPVPEPPEDSNNLDLPIGLGVGIGTAIALFTLGTGLFFYILKRATKLEAMSSKNSSQQSFKSYEDDEKHLLPSVPVELHCKPARAELP
ncbi:Hypothetical protein NCS54_00999200 [Fusarium falciforme]|uniref:Hypothetical protein n=1 Tax=Fusarium falciforme TaxID=195108 RepID=UPI00230195C0|nr:Hypothetical protein NCS54_00999200 [Fusarium falciforme]WAO92480.1 Hypothetical protein NCS54_00999200 [Fusarium falciforme]